MVLELWSKITDHDVRVLFWVLYFVPLDHGLALCQYHSFYYCSFVSVLKSRCVRSPALFIQDGFGGVLVVAQLVMNPTSIHEDPGLAQWTKDSVLP